jgi:hypothetical protein
MSGKALSGEERTWVFVSLGEPGRHYARRAYFQAASAKSGREGEVDWESDSDTETAS